MPQAGERSTTSSNSSFKCWQMIYQNELSFLSVFVLYLLWLVGFKRHWCWGLSFLYLFLSQLHYDCVTFMLWTIFRRKESHFWHIVCRYVFSFLFWGKSHQVCEKSFSLLLNQGMHALDYIIYKFTYLCVCSTWIKFKEQKHTT